MENEKAFCNEHKSEEITLERFREIFDDVVKHPLRLVTMNKFF